MSWVSVSGGQSIEALVSASVLSKNIQGWLPLGLTGLISTGVHLKCQTLGPGETNEEI